VGATPQRKEREFHVVSLRFNSSSFNQPLTARPKKTLAIDSPISDNRTSFASGRANPPAPQHDFRFPTIFETQKNAPIAKLSNFRPHHFPLAHDSRRLPPDPRAIFRLLHSKTHSHAFRNKTPNQQTRRPPTIEAPTPPSKPNFRTFATRNLAAKVRVSTIPPSAIRIPPSTVPSITPPPRSRMMVEKNRFLLSAAAGRNQGKIAAKNTNGQKNVF